MQKFYKLFLISFLLFNIFGCAKVSEFKNKINGVAGETQEAYDNVKNEIVETKTQIENASQQVKEAAESVNNALGETTEALNAIDNVGTDETSN